MIQQLKLFDLEPLRLSDGTFTSKRVKKAMNRLQSSVKYLYSVTDFQPMRIRQLSEEILILKEKLKKYENN